MRTIATFLFLSTLAVAGPDGPGRIRYRELEAALAEAKASGRIVLIVVARDG
jgi:hypothetical protein